jgi:hypothetical protein
VSPSDPELGGLVDQVSGRPLDGGTILSRIVRSPTETFEQMNRISAAGARRLHKTLVAMAWDAAREQLEARSPSRVRDMRLAQLKPYIESHSPTQKSIAHACEIVTPQRPSYIRPGCFRLGVAIHLDSSD